jgi:hypothetical protein
MNSQPIIDDPRPWAFSRAALTAGLRAYTNDPTLVITDLYEMTIPFRRGSVGRIRGLNAACDSADGKKFFRLAVKEPQGSTRAGTAGAGLREVSFYRNLSDQLPVRVPRLFANHPDGNWLIMEMLPLERKPETWAASDYLLAIEQLVALHDRFWGLGPDLAAYPWLARPLGSDYAINIQAATTGVRKLIDNSNLNMITRDPKLVQLIKRLVEHADQVASALRVPPATLLHGDYWPGNITLSVDGGFFVYDWQQAAIGPGVLDLIHFVQASQWYFHPLPVTPKELTTHYRSRLADTSHQVWDDNDWDALWDYALLWNFLTNWVDMLVNIPGSVMQTQYLQMRSLWLDPVSAAINRRLPGD